MPVRNVFHRKNIGSYRFLRKFEQHQTPAAMKKQQIIVMDVLFILIIILLLGLSYLSYLRIERLKDASLRVSHTNEVKVHLNAAFVHILDSESNLRGFIITGDEKYLKHYNNDFSRAREEVQKVIELTSDNPAQHDHTQKLKRLVDRRLEIMNQTLEHHKNSGDDIDSELEQGRRISDSIRNCINALKDHENILLFERVRERKSESFITPVWVLAFSIIAIILVILAYLKLRRETHLRMSAQDNEAVVRRLQEETRNFATSLELKVEERTKELQQKNITLENMNNELLSFNYVASHDLQEPLRKIRAFISRIDEHTHEFSPVTKNYFERINSAAVRMQKLIEALISYSRANNIDDDFVTADLTAILADVKLDLQEVITEKQAIIENDELPSLRVIPMQIHQLFTNIISNAIKYSKPTENPYVKITSTLLNNPGDVKKGVYLPHARYWKISFSDNGIGFEKDYEEKIFELFQRLHGKNEFEGTGIGLAICRKIMQNHDGYIFAESAPGKGATFSIYFPMTSYESV